MSEALERVAAVLATQHGLVTARQAADAGVDRQACRRLVTRGLWERPARGLYGPAGVPWTWRRRLMATVLLAPRGAVASHRCAATLLGVGGLEDPAPEISIPRGSSLRRTGAIVHESTDLHLADVRCVDGIPTTGPRRLAVDLGAVVSESRFRHTIRELRFDHDVTADDLLRTYLRHKRSGRNGGAALRAWLDRYYHVEGVPESGLEQVAVDALLDGGLPAPTLQLWVVTEAGRFRLDVAYPEAKVVIEVDGRQHEDRESLEADRVRDEALASLGWTVIRVRSTSLASDLARAIGICRQLVTTGVTN